MKVGWYIQSLVKVQAIHIGGFLHQGNFQWNKLILLVVFCPGVGEEMSREQFIFRALDYLLSFMDQEARTGMHDRVAQLMEAWLSLYGRANSSGNNSGGTSTECVEGFKALSDSFFRCYPLSSRKALFLAARQAVQSHHPLSHALLHVFFPLAFVALYIPPSATDDTSLMQQYYSEAVKLILLAFTSLGVLEGGGGAVDEGEDVATLQSQHLSMSLPALIHFLTETLKPVDPSSAAILRTLVSQAMLSVARTAPQPFKEQVRRQAANSLDQTDKYQKKRVGCLVLGRIEY